MHRHGKGIVPAALLVAVIVGACDRGSGSDGATGVRPDVVAKAVAERCRWDPEQPAVASSDEVRDAFVRAGDSPLSLLLSGTEFGPGERIDVALDNDTERTVRYGLGRGLRDARTGEELIDDIFVPAIALFVEPGEVGECVSIELPDSVPPGEYVAYVSSVRPEKGPTRDVEAEFTVVDDPAPEPERVRAGVIEPTKRAVEVLWHPDGEVGPLVEETEPSGGDCDEVVEGSRSRREFRDAIEAAFPDRWIQHSIDRSACPAVLAFRIAKVQPNNVSRFVNTVGRARQARADRVALIAVPFTPREFRAEVRKARRILEEEGYDSVSMQHTGVRGDATLELNFAELEAAVKERLDAEVAIPIRYRVASGPEG